jgi:hypothetical protein
VISVLFTSIILVYLLKLVIFITFHLYADDTVMYAIVATVYHSMALTRIDHSILELQSDFVTIQNALVGLKLVFNVGKTKYMLFSSSLQNVSDGLHMYSLDGSPIDRVPDPLKKMFSLK